MALNGVREQIDDVDERILELLAERRGLVREVATLKDRTSGALRSPKREREVLDRLVGAGRRRALDGRLVTRVFQEILADSLDLQERLARDAARNGSDGDSAAQPIRAAFQGIAGAYSHLAARRFFGDGPEVTCEGLPEFGDVIAAVERGDATHGVLPVENSSAGSVHAAYDLLLDTRLAVVGEIVLPVEHCAVPAVRPYRSR